MTERTRAPSAKATVRRVRRPMRMNRRARMATPRPAVFTANGSRLDLVAETSDGDDVPGVGGIGLDLGAQTPDVDIDQPAVAEVVVAPHPLEQLLPAEHAA